MPGQQAGADLVEVGVRADDGVRRAGHAASREVGFFFFFFFRGAVLADGDGGRAGATGALGQLFQGRGRDVLEFGGDRVGHWARERIRPAGSL